MNEQFENLMYQAGLTASGCWDQMDSYDKKAIQKFAELIVVECAMFVVTELEGKIGSAIADATANRLEEHFGVEE